METGGAPEHVLVVREVVTVYLVLYVHYLILTEAVGGRPRRCCECVPFSYQKTHWKRLGDGTLHVFLSHIEPNLNSSFGWY